MNIKQLTLSIEQAQKVCNEMNKCANKFILQDSIDEMKKAINYTRCCTELNVVDSDDDWIEEMIDKKTMSSEWRKENL